LTGSANARLRRLGILSEGNACDGNLPGIFGQTISFSEKLEENGDGDEGNGDDKTHLRIFAESVKSLKQSADLGHFIAQFRDRICLCSGKCEGEIVVYVRCHTGSENLTGTRSEDKLFSNSETQPQ
jgi:hypothetical protein